MGNYQHRRPLLPAPVVANSAAVIDVALRKNMPQLIAEYRMAGKDGAADHLEFTIAGIHEAAKAYHARLAEDRGDTPTQLMVAPEPETVPHSDTMDLLTSKQAGELLGITDRQARNLLLKDKIHGSRIGKQWFVEPSAIEQYKLRKDAA